MATNFQLAPAPKTVDGLNAVPMDIQQVQASFVFDAARQSSSASATVTFITGNNNGCPVFDLRQTITSAKLDGVSIPVTDMAQHNFGGGVNAEMRIINKSLTANTTHSLQLNYSLALPQSPAGGSYQPNLAWGAGPRLTLNFGFTDLAPARYLESWLPSNLIFDQFSIQLEIQMLNTAIPHSLITNAETTVIASNHWQLNFPASSTALSTLLEIRASDSVQHQSDTVVLPVSGRTITIHAWKLTTGPAVLSTEISRIKTFLTANETEYGAYLHGNTFTVFFNIGGMEYDGACTTGTGSLKHEVFHSWWARGMKPASQPDGWWDEAWTTYFNDNGGTSSLPFDFSSSPVELRTQNEWSRITSGGAYTQGNRFWQGISAMIGNSNLKNYMKDFFARNKNVLVKTHQLAEYLLCRSGNPQVVDAFHRFVYGFSNPTSAPDLWLKDDAADTFGNNDWIGRFWDSPDIWVRNKNDDGLTHQNPEYGQDNWIYARVRNKSASVTAKFFMVAFNVKQFAGTQFNYPGDFLPCVTAASGFNLAEGNSMIVKAKWPRSKVPVAGNHACLTAAVITRGEHPAANKFVWESNNLAQKNLTIVDLQPNRFILLPFVISNLVFHHKRKYTLEIYRPKKFPEMPLSVLHEKPKLFEHHLKTKPFITGLEKPNDSIENPVGNFILEKEFSEEKIITDKNFKKAARLGGLQLQEIFFDKGKASSLALAMQPKGQLLMYLKATVPETAKAGDELRLDVLQRDLRTKKITGGIALIINVKK